MHQDVIDIQDARPRQPDEPGEHTHELLYRFPDDEDLEPVLIRWYREGRGGYSMHRPDGSPLRPRSVEYEEADDTWGPEYEFQGVRP